LINRGQGNIFSCKTRDVSHIAFGSKILGPPPSSNRRVSTRIRGEVRRLKLQWNCCRFYKRRGGQAEESHGRFLPELMWGGVWSTAFSHGPPVPETP